MDDLYLGMLHDDQYSGYWERNKFMLTLDVNMQL